MKKIIKTLFVLSIAFLIIYSYYYLKDNKDGLVNIIKLNDNEQIQVDIFSGEIVKISSNLVSMIDSYGNEKWAINCNFSNVKYKITNEYIVLYEIGKNEILKVYPDGKKKEIILKYPIVKLNINSSNVITGILYDKNNIVYINNNDKENYLTSNEIPLDAKYIDGKVYVLNFFIDDKFSKISNLSIYKEDENGYSLVSVDKLDEIFVEILVVDDKIIFVNKDKLVFENKSSYNIKNVKRINIIKEKIYLEYFKEIVILDKYGKKMKSKNIEKIENIYYVNDDIFVENNNKIEILDKNIKTNIYTNIKPQKILKYKKYHLLVYNDKIEIILIK